MPTRRRTATKSTATKSTAAKKAATTRATAKKATATKSTATKSTAAKATAAKKAAATKATPAKATATRAASPARATPTKGVPAPGRLPTEDSPDVTIAQLRTELAERDRERDDLLARLSGTTEKLDALQREQASQTEELGKLRAVAATVDSLTSERDALRERIDGLQVDLPARIEEQVAGRLSKVTTAHAAEVRALQEERDRLAARVDELEKPRLDTAPSMSATALASHFADVLSAVAEQPSATPDSPFVASVTSFSVSAKALLRATDTGEVEVVTPEPGTVPADALSTVVLDLKLLPRIPGAGAAPS